MKLFNWNKEQILTPEEKIISENDKLIGDYYGVRINNNILERQICHSIIELAKGRIIEIDVIGQCDDLLVGVIYIIGICDVLDYNFSEPKEKIKCKCFSKKTKYPHNKEIITSFKLMETI